jgi:hypothetical protein
MRRTVPARIHVLLARDVPYGVVIRRGPAREVAIIGWDRLTDRFEVGQWLRGRIYEHRADLSPDGKHLLYFALNGRWQGEAKGAWTALSNAPYLKALTIWPEGDTWGGGGLFISASEAWVRSGSLDRPLRDESGMRLRYTSAPPGPMSIDNGHYHLRLERDGWRRRPDLNSGVRGNAVTVFDKDVTSGWTLRKRTHAAFPLSPGRGVYFDEHDLVNRATGAITPYASWEWADLDLHRDRLVWADAGKLWTGRLGANGLEGVSMLYDFNPLRFERLIAPY